MKNCESLCLEFFRRRFPNDVDKAGNIKKHSLFYYGEWLDRFEGGFPERYMDKKSKEVFIELLEDRV